MVKKYGKLFFVAIVFFLMMGLCLFGTSIFAVASEEVPVIKVGDVFNYAIDSSYSITEEEQDLLQEQELYRVGMENLYSPICYKTESGEFTGVAVDVLAMLAESTGIAYEIVEFDADTAAEELAQLDFSFISYAGADGNMSIESDVYYQAPFMLIERNMDDEKTIENIGVLQYYGISEWKVDNQIYDRNIQEYTTIVEMQTAYNQGEIDSFIVTTSTLNAIRNDFVDLNFVSRTIDTSLNLTMIFQDGYAQEKIQVFNKLIAQLNETDMDNIAMFHVTNIVTQANATSRIDWVLKNLMLTKVIIGLLVVVIVYVEWKRKRNLHRIINLDALTGLASRHAFFEKSAKLIERGEPNQYSIISLDIDNFKYINESFGYKNGSKVLNIIAKNIEEFSITTQLVARADADNFLMLVERKDLMDKIEFSVADGNGLYEQLWPYLGRAYRITFSMGVYDVADKNLDLNFMIDCANLARSLGKGTAQTTINRFTADMDSLRIINNDIVASMLGALEKEEFQLYYQPKIDLLTEEMVGAEVLVRWSKEGKMVQPVHFIPLFERNGFIEQLDYYILEKACQFIGKHPETPKISVNFSGVTIVQDDLEKRIFGMLEQYGVKPSQIDMEITETAFVEKIERSLEKIETLRAKGITISMDDFGAGISSLNRLKNIPLDIIKIDREFIVDSLENQKGAEIIKNVIRMAKDLQLEIVAEGIETKEQGDYLRNLGCDVGQGYFFSRPVPESDFVLLLEKNKKK